MVISVTGNSGGTVLRRNRTCGTPGGSRSADKRLRTPVAVAVLPSDLLHPSDAARVVTLGRRSGGSKGRGSGEASREEGQGGVVGVVGLVMQAPTAEKENVARSPKLTRS